MAFVSIPISASANIAAVEFEEETKTLRIIFVRDDRSYLYHDVPANVAEGFRSSGLTAGRYFLSAIKNRYGYEEES